MPAHRVPVLTDPDVAPDEVQIRAALGEAFPAWQGLETALIEPPFRLALSWRYYRDGGWLRRALRGTRNLAWLAVWKDHATITFYFAARHREALVALPIPDALRHQAEQAKMMGRISPIVIDIRSQADAETALEVLRYKLEAKWAARPGAGAERQPPPSQVRGGSPSSWRSTIVAPSRPTGRGTSAHNATSAIARGTAGTSVASKDALSRA